MVIPDITLEMSLWEDGFANVAGVDEAGKGPWAGPVTAGAVVIHSLSQVVSLVRDSKLMSFSQREKAYEEIVTKSSATGIGIVSAEEIDTIGIDMAVKKAMLLALSEIEKKGFPLSFVIVDGSKTKPLEIYQTKRILKGGLYHYSISAGSILAKVTRDRLMLSYSKEFPEYGFEKHVGYGTALHQKTLKEFGPCPLHRKSFAPVREALKHSAIIQL
ncbi:MAG TPA: ribonuclease HII [Patescibacteria group bacterium]|nr:ribonuclease HII [Patescibacteria group bacterium]